MPLCWLARQRRRACLRNRGLQAYARMSAGHGWQLSNSRQRATRCRALASPCGNRGRREANSLCRWRCCWIDPAQAPEIAGTEHGAEQATPRIERGIGRVEVSSVARSAIGADRRPRARQRGALTLYGNDTQRESQKVLTSKSPCRTSRLMGGSSSLLLRHVHHCLLIILSKQCIWREFREAIRDF